ncbi:MAG TPA: hypothetical protein VJN64_13295 [Terriglobales bacterium]|nr:hypothetical protein [Terriglobales bacterium]
MSNTIFALWIGFSAGLLLLFLYLAFLNLRNQQPRNVELGEMIPSFLPVNVAAFSELIEAQRKGDVLAREQVREIISVLERMTHNAALLQRLGYSQLNTGNPLICDLAQQMIDAGVHVRLYSFLGLAALRLWRIFGLRPALLFPAAKIAELQKMMSESLVPSYELLKNKAGNLICVKFSGYHDALIQSL